MRMATNTIYSLMQLGLARLASVATLILLARLYDEDSVGLFSLALTFQILVTGWWTGLDDKVVREIARAGAGNPAAAELRRLTRRNVSQYSLVKGAVSTLLVLLIGSALYGLGGYGATANLFVVLVLASSIPDNLIAAAVIGYVGNERFGDALIITATQVLARLIATGAVLVSGLGLLAVGGVWLGISALGALVVGWRFRAHFEAAPVGETLSHSWAYIITQHWQRARRNWSFVAMGVAVILEYQMDVLVLSWLRDTGEVGYYSVGTTLFSLLTLPLQALRMTLFPLMSRAAVRDGPASAAHTLQAVYAWAVTTTAAVTLLCLLLGIYFAEPVIDLVFGSALAPAIVPTQILMVGIVAFGLNVPHTRLLLANNQQNKVASFVIISATVNILANVWFAGWLGATGAAMARVVSTLTYLTLAYLGVRRYVALPGWRYWVTPVGAATVTWGFLAVADAWPWWMTAGAACALYGGVWWVLAGLTPTRGSMPWTNR